jgi:hypothetical protein
MKQFTFNKAIEGYFIYAQARGFSDATIADYTAAFTRFGNFIGEKPTSMLSLPKTSSTSWPKKTKEYPRKPHTIIISLLDRSGRGP